MAEEYPAHDKLSTIEYGVPATQSKEAKALSATITIDDAQFKPRELILRSVPGEQVRITLPGGKADGGSLTVDASTVGITSI
jgi:hypothetical protein